MQTPPDKPDTFTKRLLLVEDHAIVRESLVGLIHQRTGYRVVAATGDGREALEHAMALQPDVMLVDFYLEGGFDGLELVKALRSACPKARLIVLTALSHGQRGEEVLRCGADGFIGKSDPPQHLFAVLSGEVPGGMERGPQTQLSVLSDRETSVLRLFAAGYTVREIAANLGISRKTIETHRCNIREKLNVGTSDELRTMARRYFGNAEVA